jgi:carbonic anhydrase
MEEIMRKLLYCASLSTLLLGYLSGCSGQETPEKTEEKTKTEVVETVTKENGHDEAHWSYEGETGPEQWGKLETEFASCSKGKEQSPINLDVDESKKDSTQQQLELNYAPTAVNVVNNGHTIQANLSNEKNTIVVDGTEYTLVQFHFHTPSEHQFEGKNLPIEYHLVHKSADEKLAVLGVMVEEGTENEVLADVWSTLPKEETEKGIDVKQPVDLAKLLPADQSTFRYNGSLTTPPCSEGVKWTVFEETVQMSADQIQDFSEIFPENNRPVQQLHQREVITN